MASNLKTTKFNNGTAIPNVSDIMGWSYLSTPAYSWYDNDMATYQSSGYGVLYNFFTVEAGNICPAGYHVPTSSEWAELSAGLGGDLVAGGKLKEIGLVHWLSPNTGATDEVGFTALPAGLRNYLGMFMQVGVVGNWWSSSVLDIQSSLYYVVNTGMAELMQQPENKLNGLSVRCIQGLMPSVVAPTVTTTTFTPGYIDATGGGNVTADGGAPVIERGVCWSLTPSPTIADSRTFDGNGPGVFVSNISGLSMASTYYVRAYATNSAGTSYGNEVMFTTLVAK